MNALDVLIFVTAALVFYWVFWGQARQREMMFPKRKTELKAILFDTDGVLVDSEDAWFVVINALLKKYNKKTIDKKTYLKRYFGMSPGQIHEKYFREQDKKEIVDFMSAPTKDFYDNSQILPNVKETLDFIKKKKLPMAVVSNSPKKALQKRLKHHKLDTYFSAIISSDDVEYPKPYPDGILEAAKQLGVDADECLFVGDRPSDYTAAQSAQTFFVGMNTTGDIMIKDLSALKELL